MPCPAITTHAPPSIGTGPIDDQTGQVVIPGGLLLYAVDFFLNEASFFGVVGAAQELSLHLVNAFFQSPGLLVEGIIMFFPDQVRRLGGRLPVEGGFQGVQGGPLDYLYSIPSCSVVAAGLSCLYWAGGLPTEGRRGSLAGAAVGGGAA